MEKKKMVSPVTVIGVWIVSMLLLMPILLITGSATELLSSIVSIPVIILSGVALIAISIPLLFNQWYRNNKWISLLLMIASLVPLLYFFLS